MEKGKEKTRAVKNFHRLKEATNAVEHSLLNEMVKVHKTTQFQFDLNDQRLPELEDLMKMGGVGTLEDLFNNALTLLAWAMKERSEGRSIASVSSDSQSYRELQMPMLMNVGKHPSA